MKQNSNKFAIGRTLIDQSQEIDKIKIYASEIFAQNDVQSEVSFQISQSEASENKYAKYIGKHNTKRKYTQQLEKFYIKDDQISWGQQYNDRPIKSSYIFRPEKHNKKIMKQSSVRQDGQQTMRVVIKQYNNQKKINPKLSKYPQSNFTNKFRGQSQNIRAQQKQKNGQRYVAWKKMSGSFYQPILNSNKPHNHSGTKLYKSPYSRQLCQISNGQNYKSQIDADRELSEAKKLKKKLFQINAQHQNIQKQVQTAKKQNRKMVKFSSKNMNSRYMEQKKIMDGYAGYISKNIYGRVKTQHNFSNSDRYLKNRPSYDKSMSKQKKQKLWSSFIQKNKDWESNKNNKLMQKRLQQQRDQRNLQKAQINNTKQPQPPSVQEYLKRLNRQKLNLKQKLLGVEYTPTIYVNQRAVYKSGRINQKQQKAGEPQSKQKIAKSSLPNFGHKQQSQYQIKNKIKLKNPEEIWFVMNKHLQH